MQHHGDRLNGIGGKFDLRAVDERIAFLRAEGELSADELTQIYTLPARAAEQSMRVGQSVDAPIQHREELVGRFGRLSGTLGNRGHTRKDILHTMVEFGNQQVLVVLGLSTFRHVDVDARHTFGATGLVIINEASRFDPPDFTSRQHNAEFIDEFMSPLLEGMDMFGAQTLPIVPMHPREPLLAGQFYRVMGGAVDRGTGARYS